MIVFTDGACLSNGASPTLASIGVYFGPDSPYNISNIMPMPEPTNQKAEISAALEALRKVRLAVGPARREAVKDYPWKWISSRGPFRFRLVVVSDSAYFVNNICDNIKKWTFEPSTHTYKNKSGEPIKNSHLFVQVDQEVKLLWRMGIRVEWSFQRREKNRGADTLARLAISKAG